MDLKIQLFRIEEIGFYRGEEGLVFGPISEWYPDFLRWVDQNRVDYQLTKTFERTSRYPTSIFCAGAIEDEGDFGVTLWNEGHRNSRGVMFVQGSGRIEELRAGTVEVSRENRPGWPSYFWVMPRDNLVAAFMPEGLASSIGSFRDYFKGYLRSESQYSVPHEVTDPSTGETKTKYRYQAYQDDEPTPSVFPRVRTSQSITYEHIQNILDKWEDIHRFTLHSNRVFMRPDHRSAPGGLLERIFFTRRSVEQRDEVSAERWDTVVRVEMDWKPSSKEEVKTVIEDWLREEQGEENWAGVKFEGSGTQHRFDEGKSVKEIEEHDEGVLLNSEVGSSIWNEEQLKRVWEIHKGAVQQLHQKAAK